MQCDIFEDLLWDFKKIKQWILFGSYFETRMIFCLDTLLYYCVMSKTGDVR